MSPADFIKHLLDIGYDFGVQIVVGGLTHDESEIVTAANRKQYGPAENINSDGPPNGTIIFVARKV